MGQGRTRTIEKIPRQYYNKGDGFILIFDVTSKMSFTDVTSWIRDIRENNTAGSAIKILLVGNKVDSFNKREVIREEAETLAKEHRLNYGEISCKSWLNIRKSMMNLIIEAYSGIRENQNSFSLEGTSNENKKKWCCWGGMLELKGSYLVFWSYWRVYIIKIVFEKCNEG